MYLRKISIICTFQYEFLNDCDAQSEFDKKFITKKTGQVEPFLSKYALKRLNMVTKCYKNIKEYQSCKGQILLLAEGL